MKKTVSTRQLFVVAILVLFTISMVWLNLKRRHQSSPPVSDESALASANAASESTESTPSATSGEVQAPTNVAAVAQQAANQPLRGRFANTEISLMPSRRVSATTN